MKKEIVAIGVCAILLLVVFNSGCIDLGGKEKKEEVIDTDGDGVPDYEDDYPTDPVYRAKLKVTKINWYQREREVDVIFEYENNKSYNLYWVTPFATIKRADGVLIKTYASTWGDIAADILKPGEKCYAWVPFETDAEVASAEAEIKGESPRGWETTIKELKVEIVSHNGTYDNATGKYTISGMIKNNGEEAETTNIYAGIFAVNGTLLDVQEAWKIYIPVGESAMFTTTSALWTTNGATPEADKISTYELCITRY